MKVGYPCMNLYLRSCSFNRIRCNRSCTKNSIEKYGFQYIEEKCRKNLENLMKILQWNVQNDIYFYRITSELIPWFSKHQVKDLNNSKELFNLLSKIGNFIRENNIRVSFHPDHFVKLASNTDSTVENSILDLEYQGKILDLMSLDREDYYPINIHIGATYEGMEGTAERFEKNYYKLDESVRERLVVENDDKESCWGISDLLEINDRTGVPIVLDTLHHTFSGDIEKQEAFNLARDTWSSKPVVHHSNSVKKYEEGNSKRGHTDWIYYPVDLEGEYDLMIEAGKKEQALFKYKYDFMI